MTALSASRDAAVPMSYSFGPGAPTGLFLGLGLPRLGTLAAGLLSSVGLLAERSGLLIACCPMLLTATVTLLPLAGRPLAGWVGPGMRHAFSAMLGSDRWTPDVPTLAVGSSQMPRERLRLPAECGRVHLLELAGSGSWPIALIRDGRSAAAIIVFAVAGVDRFGLLDPEGQDRLIAGWSRTLIALAQRDRGAGRVQLLERVTVADSDIADAARWTTDRAAGDGAEMSALTSAIDDLTVRRESYLVLRCTSLRDSADALTRAREIATQLLAADLVARPLNQAELAHVFARMLNPGQHGGGATVGAVSRRTHWEHVRTDDSWHRAFAVASWPGSPVPAGWLSSLLLATPPGGAWSTAFHLDAVAPEIANRLARAARAKAELERADRARLGMPASAAADNAVNASAGMDAELVAGHSTYRLAAVLTCTADSSSALDESSRVLRDAATAAGLTIRPLHGQHHLALAATLPLCRLRFGGAL
jgi:hypothetical protein